MRIIDLHCYPDTDPLIKSQGPYVEALGKYWRRSWTAKSEAEVIEEFKKAGVEAVLVAFDIETVAGTPPCSNEYVAKMRDDNPGVILQAWAAVDPFKGERAIEEAKKAINELRMLGFHFHPINVSWELSGWAPKYFPEALKRDIKGRLKDKIMFGSDYPSIPYARLFREWGELGYAHELMEKIFHANAERILGLKARKSLGTTVRITNLQE